MKAWLASERATGDCMSARGCTENLNIRVAVVTSVENCRRFFFFPRLLMKHLCFWGITLYLATCGSTGPVSDFTSNECAGATGGELTRAVISKCIR